MYYIWYRFFFFKKIYISYLVFSFSLLEGRSPRLPHAPRSGSEAAAVPQPCSAWGEGALPSPQPLAVLALGTPHLPPPGPRAPTTQLHQERNLGTAPNPQLWGKALLPPLHLTETSHFIYICVYTHTYIWIYIKK